MTWMSVMPGGPFVAAAAPGRAIELPFPLRYRAEPDLAGDRQVRHVQSGWDKDRQGRQILHSHQRLSMSSTFDTVAKIIAETCDIPADTITPDSHAINDLGIDSLDFLDIAFAIDKAFGIKLPLEQWTQEVNDGKATTEQYFVMTNLCARIDDLVAAKGA
jgi:acyl carrier protein